MASITLVLCKGTTYFLKDLHHIEHERQRFCGEKEKVVASLVNVVEWFSLGCLTLVAESLAFFKTLFPYHDELPCTNGIRLGE
ncbi:MAG: hypothetical protein ABI594_13045 [Ginsengibacter sp.]